MDKENLIKYILNIFPMSDEKVSTITGDFEFISFEKGDLLLTENKINRQTFFLETGYVRSFTLDQNGQEVTTNIYPPPGFVNDFLSFFKQLPAKQNFQALTPCTGWTMSYENVEKYFSDIPEFREFGRLLVLFHYENLNERMLGMIKDSAETRYLKLSNQHPDVLRNVSLKIIASYLGITDTSLSRIRKEIIHR